MHLLAIAATVDAVVRHSDIKKQLAKVRIKEGPMKLSRACDNICKRRLPAKLTSKKVVMMFPTIKYSVMEIEC